MRRSIDRYSMLLLVVMIQCTTFASRSQCQSTWDSPSVTKAKEPAAAGAKSGKKTSATYDEDFTVLPVSQNKLKLELAVLGEKNDDANKPFIRERYHLEWRPGDAIDVYIVKPRKVEKPPAVIYLYSYPQDTERFKQDAWCSYAVGDGFAAIGFVSALTAHRLEYRAPREDFFNQLPESLGATVHDVQMILDFVASLGQLDMNRIGMFGQGSGGGIAILASAVDARIKALDLLTPWGDWPDFIEHSTFVPSEDRLVMNTREFRASVAGLDPVKWFPRVKAESVRMQNVRSDHHMPDQCQERMEDTAPPITEIEQFGDAAALVPAAANGKLLEWIKSRLQADAKPQLAQDKAQRTHFHPAKTPKNPLGEVPAGDAAASGAAQAKQ